MIRKLNGGTLWLSSPLKPLDKSHAVFNSCDFLSPSRLSKDSFRYLTTKTPPVSVFHSPLLCCVSSHFLRNARHRCVYLAQLLRLAYGRGAGHRRHSAHSALRARADGPSPAGADALAHSFPSRAARGAPFPGPLCAGKSFLFLVNRNTENPRGDP